MSTARELDENGFLIVRGCPISSFGIFDYGAGQLGLPGDPMRIVKVYRPESAVMEPEAIESFKNVPLIDDHVMLSGFQKDDSAADPDDKGVSGVLTSNIYYESPWMRGDLKVFSRDMQNKIGKGKRDLSLGYSCKFEIKPGTFDGQPYEVVQTELRGNHIALVGEGRVPGARVLDGLCFDHLSFEVKPSDKEPPMSKAAKKAAMDSSAIAQLIAQLKALVPAFEQYLSEEAAEPAHQGEAAAGDPQVDPTVDPTVAAGVDPAAGEAAPNPAATSEGEKPTIDQMVKNVEDVLAQLKGMQPASGADNAKPEDNPGGMDNDTPNPEEQKPGMDNDQPANAEANGKASPGPAAGTHANAADAAMAKFYADAAEKGKTYERLSKVVGAFDSASMTAKQVCEYGVKKLNLKCSAGQEGIALDAYLTGIEAAQKVTKVPLKTNAADGKVASAELDAYLEGK